MNLYKNILFPVSLGGFILACCDFSSVGVWFGMTCGFAFSIWVNNK